MLVIDRINNNDSLATYHELRELLVQFLLVGHGCCRGESLEREAAPGIVRHAVRDLRRVVGGREAAAPASTSPPHLGGNLSGLRPRLHVALEAGELGLEAGGHLARELAEVGFGKFGSMNLSQTQPPEDLGQTGAGEPVTEAIKLYVG